MKNHKKNRCERIAEKAARLVPAEVKAAQAGDAVGGGATASQVARAVATNAGPTHGQSGEPVRKTVLDEEFDGHKWFGCRPVLVVILGLSLAFIAAIAYLISRQP